MDAQRLQFTWVEASTDLSSVSVVCTDQDDWGFIWVATRNGLYRYDGTEFEQYLFSETEALSNNIQVVYVDSHGDIWAGSKDELRRYNPKYDRFDKMLDAPTRNLFENEDQEFFAATGYGKVFRYNRETEEFVSLNTEYLQGVVEVQPRRAGGFWVGGETGLFHYDAAMQQVEAYGLPNTGDNGLNATIYTIAEDKFGRAWVGTERYGISVLDPKTKHYQSAPYQPEDGRVGRLVIDEHDTVYAGTSGGLCLYDLDLRRIARYTHKDHEPSSIRRGTVYAIDFDRDGNLWLGTSRAGLGQVSGIRNFNNFVHSEQSSTGLTGYSVISVFEDSRENLWVGYYYGGLDRFDKDTGRRTHYSTSLKDGRKIPIEAISRIIEDDNGVLWFATNHSGLHRFDYESGVLQQYSLNDPTKYIISSITLDRDSTIILSSEDEALERFDPRTETFTMLETASPGWVRDIYLKANGDLWILHSSGIKRYSTTTGMEDIVSLHENHTIDGTGIVQCSHVDRHGITWVGMTNGLVKVSPEGELLRHYGIEDGLANMEISSIESDAFGSIWCSTKGGLSRLYPATELFENYHPADGLVSNQFITNASFASPSGTLYFGSEGGLSFFQPKALKRNDQPPEIVFTSFKVFNEEVPVSDAPDAILDKSILLDDRVILPPGNDVFTVQFAALNYIVPEKNQYAYMLEGFDRGWTYSGNRNACTYTNLDPGIYTLHVKACNNDGIWNHQGATLQIEVLPWFWQTPWFILSTGLAIVITAVAAYQLRIRSMRRQRVLLQRTVKERTQELELLLAHVEAQNKALMMHREHLESMVNTRTKELEIAKNEAELSDRIKTAFLQNMSHEIRTPMNAIVGFLEMLKADDLTREEHDDFSNIIRSNSQTLLVLIDDILDMARLEAGELRIDREPVLLNDLMYELEAVFEQERHQLTKSEIKLYFDETYLISDFKLMTDPTRLRQILGNLLGNALKFTDKGRIWFSYRLLDEDHENPQIEFTVGDTGIGIPEEHLNVIFKRFRKGDGSDTGLYRGAGLGLAIVEKLTTIMGGRVVVESTPGQGSIFTILLPYERPPSA
ncbi:histidine kinase [Coraliomargarita akajimensis DSM 45221]|uniref:histidine kinase n=2 Tax=Coraliomargarita TaxID=442430 RepID=D5EHK8_CORAD|nr:histidine kinase [Coraliomargarita akajimensis DSM 45221]